MPSDEEYLAEAGIDAEGNALVSETEATAQEAEAQKQAIEELIFEHGGKQYRVPSAAELQFKHAGQMSKRPINSILNGYRQLGDYNAKLADLNKRGKEFETRQQELDKFVKIQEWSQQNPEIFEWVWKNYENRDRLGLLNNLGQLTNGAPAEANAQASLPPQVIQLIESMQKEISGLKEFKTSFDKQQAEAQDEQDIKFINGQIVEFQKFLDNNFPNAGIKLDSVDDDGIPLSSKIIKFGIDKKYPDFDGAALAYLKDTLITNAVSKGREDAVKNIQAETRKGVVTRSDKPVLTGEALQPEQSRNKSYGQLAAEAKQELAELNNS